MDARETIESLQAAHASIQARLNELHERQAEVSAAIDDFALAAKGGNVAGVGEMQSLAAENAKTNREISAAENDLQSIEGNLVRAQNKYRREQFDAAAAAARQHRADFIFFFRQAALALGKFCKAMETGTAAANSITDLEHFGGVDRTMLRELETNLDPHFEWDTRPITNWGWNLRFTVEGREPKFLETKVEEGNHAA